MSQHPGEQDHPGDDLPFPVDTSDVVVALQVADLDRAVGERHRVLPSARWGRGQYQPTLSLWAHAPHGVP